MIAEAAQLSPAEWDAVVQLASQQRVAPLLYQRLKSQPQLAAGLPAAAKKRLHQQYQANAVRNLLLFHELGVILRLLQADAIPVIVLKGAHLANAIYANPALRSMNDFDLLVTPAQAPLVAEKLLMLGYQPLSPLTPIADMTWAHHWPRFINTQAGVGVEVHWTITQPQHLYTIAMDDLWQRAVPLRFANVTALGFATEDLLLHLCLHATYQHLFEQGLRPLCDIDALVRRYQAQLDWAQIEQRADAWRWRKGVHITLYLAHTLLATPIPAATLKTLQPPDFSDTTVEMALACIFSPKQMNEALSRNFSQMWQSERWLDKARRFGQSLFLPRTMLANMYQVAPDSPKIYWYYLVRLWDLLVRYGDKVWRLWRRETDLQAQIQHQSALLGWLETTV
jgi:hypothetical protein